MSERIMTLFGEEIVPEQQKAAGKSRAKKNTDDNKEEAGKELPAATTADPADDAKPVEEINNANVPQLSEVKETPEPDHAAANEDAPVVTDARSADLLDIDDSTVIAEPTADTGDAGEAAQTVEEQATYEVVAGTKKKQSRTKEKEEHINLPEDWKGDKNYYAIGEVADLFKVKTSHIRFWTNEFKLKVRTTRKGDRLYTPDQIRELRTIHHLVKERGFTLTGAKAKLKEQNSIDVQTVDLKQSLIQLRNKLMIIKNQLT